MAVLFRMTAWLQDVIYAFTDEDRKKQMIQERCMWEQGMWSSAFFCSVTMQRLNVMISKTTVVSHL